MSSFGVPSREDPNFCARGTQPNGTEEEGEVNKLILRRKQKKSEEEEKKQKKKLGKG